MQATITHEIGRFGIHLAVYSEEPLPPRVDPEYAKRAAYACGLLPPNYPVPAIWYEMSYIGDKENPFYGVALRNSNGWADFTWSPEYGSESHSRTSINVQCAEGFT